jgi:hypothetical protein
LAKRIGVNPLHRSRAEDELAPQEPVKQVLAYIISKKKRTSNCPRKIDGVTDSLYPAGLLADPLTTEVDKES